MTNMFHTTANFSGITDTTPVFVTKVLQAAYIEVNEEGSDAVPYASECNYFMNHRDLILFQI